MPTEATVPPSCTCFISDVLRQYVRFLIFVQSWDPGRKMSLRCLRDESLEPVLDDRVDAARARRAAVTLKRGEDGYSHVLPTCRLDP